MLGDVELDQSIISSTIISSTYENVIDNIIIVCEYVLHHNEKDTPMHGSIPKVYDDEKKFMEGVLSLFTENWLCDRCE